MFMPHIPPPQKLVPHIPLPHAEGADSGAAFPARAAKVEYWVVRWSWPHEGHFTASASALRRTSFSNLLPQSSQEYSKIGMPPFYRPSAYTGAQFISNRNHSG